MKEKKLKIGDWVRVNDPGLAMLAAYAPPGSRPNNVARVHCIEEDGTIEVAYPLGDDPISVHSQAALCYSDEVTVIEKPDWYKHDDRVKP